jgi:hypothetical protein
MKKSVIAISSVVVITTLVYALVATTFFEIDNALGKGENLVVDDEIYTQQQQQVKAECKSPCPSGSEMCIEMCA